MGLKGWDYCGIRGRVIALLLCFNTHIWPQSIVNPDVWYGFSKKLYAIKWILGHHCVYLLESDNAFLVGFRTVTVHVRVYWYRMYCSVPVPSVIFGLHCTGRCTGRVWPVCTVFEADETVVYWLYGSQIVSNPAPSIALVNKNMR